MVLHCWHNQPKKKEKEEMKRKGSGPDAPNKDEPCDTMCWHYLIGRAFYVIVRNNTDLFLITLYGQSKFLYSSPKLSFLSVPWVPNSYMQPLKVGFLKVRTVWEKLATDRNVGCLLFHMRLLPIHWIPEMGVVSQYRQVSLRETIA